MRDAGREPDAGVDGDGDGIPASADCDDADPDIGANATRTCALCEPDSGTQTCVDGMWGACEGDLSCLCTAEMEGQTRVVACPMCGMQSQQCVAGTWTDQGTCLAQGECEAGAFEHSDALCGMRERLCQTDCTWTDWTIIEPVGECDPEDEECEFLARACTSDCAWRSFSSRADCDAYVAMRM